MTHTLPMAQAAGATLLVFSLCALLSGCKPKAAPEKTRLGQTVETETESPNARILPEPLTESGLEHADPPELDDSGEPKEQLPPALVRRPLPIAGPLHSRTTPAGVTAGWVLSGTFAFPPARPVVKVEGEALPAWPTLRVELIPAFREQPGGIRLVIDSHVWALPLGSELRGRVDVEGFILVWPDGRSYRSVAQGALRTLILEHRVDRMPLVTVELSELGRGRRLGRTTRKVQASGPVGLLRLDLAEAPELGMESLLLCDFFFGLVRAATPVELCRGGEIPVYVEMESKRGSRVQFTFADVELRTDLPRQAFLMPPPLSIFKPGELPPSGSSLWPDEVFAQIFPPGSPELPLRFLNLRPVPLFLLLDGIPTSRIDPGGELTLLIGEGEHRHEARDFFGELVEPGGPIRAPADLRYGEPEPVEPL